MNHRDQWNQSGQWNQNDQLNQNDQSNQSGQLNQDDQLNQRYQLNQSDQLNQNDQLDQSVHDVPVLRQKVLQLLEVHQMLVLYKDLILIELVNDEHLQWFLLEQLFVIVIIVRDVHYDLHQVFFQDLSIYRQRRKELFQWLGEETLEGGSYQWQEV